MRRLSHALFFLILAAPVWADDAVTMEEVVVGGGVRRTDLIVTQEPISVLQVEEVLAKPAISLDAADLLPLPTLILDCDVSGAPKEFQQVFRECINEKAEKTVHQNSTVGARGSTQQSAKLVDRTCKCLNENQNLEMFAASLIEQRLKDKGISLAQHRLERKIESLNNIMQSRLNGMLFQASQMRRLDRDIDLAEMYTPSHLIEPAQKSLQSFIPGMLAGAETQAQGWRPNPEAFRAPKNDPSVLPNDRNSSSCLSFAHYMALNQAKLSPAFLRLVRTMPDPETKFVQALAEWNPESLRRTFSQLTKNETASLDELINHNGAIRDVYLKLEFLNKNPLFRSFLSVDTSSDSYLREKQKELLLKMRGMLRSSGDFQDFQDAAADIFDEAQVARAVARENAEDIEKTIKRTADNFSNLGPPSVRELDEYLDRVVPPAERAQLNFKDSLMYRYAATCGPQGQSGNQSRFVSSAGDELRRRFSAYNVQPNPDYEKKKKEYCEQPNKLANGKTMRFEDYKAEYCAKASNRATCANSEALLGSYIGSFANNRTENQQYAKIFRSMRLRRMDAARAEAVFRDAPRSLAEYQRTVIDRPNIGPIAPLAIPPLPGQETSRAPASTVESQRTSAPVSGGEREVAVSQTPVPQQQAPYVPNFISNPPAAAAALPGAERRLEEARQSMETATAALTEAKKESEEAPVATAPEASDPGARRVRELEREVESSRAAYENLQREVAALKQGKVPAPKRARTDSQIADDENELQNGELPDAAPAAVTNNAGPQAISRGAAPAVATPGFSNAQAGGANGLRGSTSMSALSAPGINSPSGVNNALKAIYENNGLVVTETADSSAVARIVDNPGSSRSSVTVTAEEYSQIENNNTQILSRYEGIIKTMNGSEGTFTVNASGKPSLKFLVSVQGNKVIMTPVRKFRLRDMASELSGAR